MIKIAHKTEAETLKHLPLEVVGIVVEITTILDENYRNARDVDHDLGGYSKLGRDLPRKGDCHHPKFVG